MDGVTVGWATARSTLSECKELLELNAVCKELVSGGDYEAFAGANRDFHNKIASMARNESLASAAMFVRVQIAPFQRFQFHSEEERRESAAEHDQFVDEIIRKDADTACREMRSHILRTGMNVVTEFSSLRALDGGEGNSEDL